jgi:hypothetical protein
MDFPPVLIRCIFLPQIDNLGSLPDDGYHLEFFGVTELFSYLLIRGNGRSSLTVANFPSTLEMLESTVRYLLLGGSEAMNHILGDRRKQP